MTGDKSGPARRATQMRRDFDQAFAHAPPTLAEGDEDLLAVRLGGDSYFIRLAEVGELFKDRKIVRVPGRRDDFVGLAGLRGGIVPVHSLERLLGHAGAGGEGPWLVLAARGLSVAFAVRQFEGHLRVGRTGIQALSASATRAHLSEVARAGNETRPIINLRSVLESLEASSAPVGI